MTVEIDQSGKIEQLDTNTVVAYANGKTNSVRINASEKRKLVKKLRTSLIPRKDLYPIIFTIVTFIVLIELKPFPDVIIVDEEYTGKDTIIKETLLKLILQNVNKNWKGSIRFKQVGKQSPAHRVAWLHHKQKRTKNSKIITARDILNYWQ